MIGVLALQGAFESHQQRLTELGALSRQVRTPRDLAGVDALVMPGGESTTMSRLLLSSELFEPLAQRIADGMPVFGTCAGMILLATEVLDGRPDHWLLAGDRTALPAIRRFAAQAASGVPVDVVVIAEDPADEQAISSPGDLRVTWVRDLDALIAALGAAPHRDGDGFAFVAAEQSVVKPARAALVAAGFDLERSIVKGYWKRGEAEYHAPH